MKAMILVDAQNDFINGVLGTKEAEAAVPRICEKLKDFDGPIIVTRDTHDAETYSATHEGKRLPVVHCVSGTDGWRIHPDIAAILETKEDVAYTNKSTFGTADPYYILCDDYGFEEDECPEIHIMGFCTDICVVSVALEMRQCFYDSDIILHANCCAGVTPESHKAALAVMKSCQIDIVEN